MSSALWQCHYVVIYGGESRPCARPAEADEPFCRQHISIVAGYFREWQQRRDGRWRNSSDEVVVLLARLHDAEARAKTPEPTVYYIERAGDGFIKIGYSVHPKSRMESLGTRVNRLTLLATEPGGRAVESLRHEQFSSLRVQGEWFRPAPVLLRHIKRLQGMSEPLPLALSDDNGSGRGSNLSVPRARSAPQ